MSFVEDQLDSFDQSSVGVGLRVGPGSSWASVRSDF